jgi:ATP-dependent DNA helicase RecG
MTSQNKENVNLRYLKGIGEKRAELYTKLGVFDINSLLRYYPRDYIDLTKPTSIKGAIFEENNVIHARVYNKTSGKRLKNGILIYKVDVLDDTGSITINIFNSKYMFDGLIIDKEYVFYGKLSGNLFLKSMTNPMFFEKEKAKEILPKYSLTKGLSDNLIRTNILSAIDYVGEIKDYLPEKIKKEYELCDLNTAIENIHFPKSVEKCEEAKKRLVFEELLILQLAIFLMKTNNNKSSGVEIKNFDISEFLKALPFELTSGQKSAINDAINDLQKKKPMKRLVQGDVGCGKTMVGGAICFIMAKNGYQSAFMAPTEILAGQHFETLDKIFSNIGIKCGLLVGSMSKKKKDEIKEKIQNGEIDIVIGTHALITDSTRFSSLGLVITDEQHRFGVEQRNKLELKGDNPHTLVMSATPIPRTLALMLYGDLEISTINELPKGRQKIETYVVNSNLRHRAFNFIKKHIKEGRQAFIVCPYIEENQDEKASAISYAKTIGEGEFRGYNIGVLHSKLPTVQKEKIMQQFKLNEIQLLVTTTVVEVGVDVPNAVIMVIENAERFGLSQLHQLRGRIGRGEYKSFCILISDTSAEKTKQRLEVLSATSDGFVIADKDLELRGPGDFFGEKQHGIPNFKIANLVNDMQQVRITNSLAKEIIKDDEFLQKKENKGLKLLVDRLMGEKIII